MNTRFSLADSKAVGSAKWRTAHFVTPDFYPTENTLYFYSLTTFIIDGPSDLGFPMWIRMKKYVDVKILNLNSLFCIRLIRQELIRIFLFSLSKYS